MFYGNANENSQFSVYISVFSMHSKKRLRILSIWNEKLIVKMQINGKSNNSKQETAFD